MKCKCKIFKKNRVDNINDVYINYNLDCTMYNGTYVITYTEWVNKYCIYPDLNRVPKNQTTLYEAN